MICVIHSVMHVTLTCSNTKDNIYCVIIFSQLLQKGQFSLVLLIVTLFQKRINIAFKKSNYIESRQILLPISFYDLLAQRHLAIKLFAKLCLAAMLGNTSDLL